MSMSTSKKRVAIDNLRSSYKPSDLDTIQRVLSVREDESRQLETRHMNKLNFSNFQISSLQVVSFPLTSHK